MYFFSVSDTVGEKHHCNVTHTFCLLSSLASIQSSIRMGTVPMLIATQHSRIDPCFIHTPQVTRENGDVPALQNVTHN
jgi:hypothetical protein